MRIGDVLYRTPSLPYLARGLPECEWTYIASPAGAEVLAGNPYISQVIEIPATDSAGPHWRRRYELLRERRFDVALCTNAVGYAADLAIAAAAGIPNRVALTHKGLAALATLPVSTRFPRPIPAYIQSIVATVTYLAPDWPLRPQLYATAADTASARNLHAGLELTGRPVMACAPASREPRGTWPPEIFAAMLCQLAADFHIVLCGGRTDEPLLRQLASDAGIPPRIIAGQLRIPALGAFFSRCAAVLTHDSGPRHVANAAGTPVGFFRILSVHPVEAGRYCDNELDLAPPTTGPLDDSRARALIARASPSEAVQRFLGFLRTRRGEAAAVPDALGPG